MCAEGLLRCHSARAAVLGSKYGLPAEIVGAFCRRGRTELRFTAVRAGALLHAAGKNVVAAFGLTGVNHAGHPFLFSV